MITFLCGVCTFRDFVFYFAGSVLGFGGLCWARFSVPVGVSCVFVGW